MRLSAMTVGAKASAFSTLHTLRTQPMKYRRSNNHFLANASERSSTAEPFSLFRILTGLSIEYFIDVSCAETTCQRAPCQSMVRVEKWPEETDPARERPAGVDDFPSQHPGIDTGSCQENCQGAVSRERPPREAARDQDCAEPKERAIPDNFCQYFMICL